MYVIRTGVPSVDELLHQRDPDQKIEESWEPGIRLPNRSTTTSFCIVGPDGAGKSVLAMHLASRYLADCVADCADCAILPHAFYISSDLTFEVAQTMWINFALHAPNARAIPFQRPSLGKTTSYNPALRLWLQLYAAENAVALANHLETGKKPGLCFIDLASHTAGDDWSCIHRLLSVLPVPEDHAPRHLMVIDAVEGMETFGGDLDVFGQQTPRRSRIAKLMRLAAGKCHVVLIVEEPAEGARLPEQFVADVVVRMRGADAHGYIRRTIEIEKARGQPIVRGRHPYAIRSGMGSTTGDQENADDLILKYKKDLTELTPTCPRLECHEWPKHQSYVLAFPSIHQISRAIMEDRGEGRQPPSPRRAGFGIHYLDQMLSESEVKDGDRRGLPCSTVTALIGDAGTQKSGLGLAFLAHAFSQSVQWMRREHQRCPGKSPEEIVEIGEIHAGVAVLITTHDESRAMMSKFFLQHLEGDADTRDFVKNGRFRAPLEKMILRRTICRRLEIHDTPGAVLLHTIRRTVEAAQHACVHGTPLPQKSEDRFKQSWPIRLVIDDFSTIMDTYAQLSADPLFLPFLLFYLRREGVTSLIEDTRAGGPYAEMEGFHTDIRAMSDHRIYTWHTDFYGDHRVAIAPIPPVSRQLGVVVRELRRLPMAESQADVAFRPKGNLDVDVRFELYTGFENNAPRPVPLNVRLYAETDACRKYAAYLNTILDGVFTPVTSDITQERRSIVVSEDPQYDRLRDLAFLQADNRLDHTLVFQVDEFWLGGTTFRKEWDYLCEARVALDDKTIDPNLDDPYGVYKEVLHLATMSDGYLKRADFFNVPGCDLHPQSVDRVPFAIDYGFLECRCVPWQHAALTAAPGSVIEKVWDTSAQAPRRDKTWRDFLEASRDVARFESSTRKEPIRAFDLSMLAPESFSCLVLEVWASEILQTLRRCHPSSAAELAGRLGTRSWHTLTEGLLDWLRPRGLVVERCPAPDAFPGYSLELYKTWLLLVEALDLDSLRNEPGSHTFQSGRCAHPLSVSTRHWYKTATMAPVDNGTDSGQRAYTRLPGAFTTRGDWFLAVASGSRSNRLGNRIIDLLCSVRANGRRLRLGIGLPARRLLKDPKRDADKLATALRTGPAGKGKRLTYQEALALGADRETDPNFGWLWRSSLRDYHRQNSLWQGWLYRLMRASQRLRQTEADWKCGFAVYDAIANYETGEHSTLPAWVTGLKSYQAFPTFCKELVAELEQVSSPDPLPRGGGEPAVDLLRPRL